MPSAAIIVACPEGRVFDAAPPPASGPGVIQGDDRFAGQVLAGLDEKPCPSRHEAAGEAARRRWRRPSPWAWRRYHVEPWRSNAFQLLDQARQGVRPLSEGSGALSLPSGDLSIDPCPSPWTYAGGLRAANPSLGPDGAAVTGST